MENNSTNGLRWYFYEAYLDGKAMNVKEFACLAQVPDSNMGRYLNGQGPKQKEMLRSIEKALGKPAYDLCKPRKTLDWERVMPILYGNKPTLRKSYNVDEEGKSRMVCEDPIEVDECSIIEQQRDEIERLKDDIRQLRNVLKLLKHENELLQKLVNSRQYD